jgi:hypothetical protein
VNFFDEQQNYLESRDLKAGDVILLVKGGHGFEVLEEIEMIEVKQGPYAGDQDKTRLIAPLPSAPGPLTAKSATFVRSSGTRFEAKHRQSYLRNGL